jgi:parallel beta-helix repeat protein
MLLIPLLAITIACDEQSPTAFEPSVDASVLSTVIVEPSFVEAYEGDTIQFVATAYDLAQDRVPAEFVWVAAGGFVSPDGLFTAGSEAGEYEVAAEPTSVKGNGLAKGHEKRGVARIRIKSRGQQNRPPDPSFSHTCSGLDCEFDGSASADSDGTVTGHEWEFGDEGTAAGPKVSHRYAAPGEYAVVLSVSDDSAAVGTLERTVVVEETEPDSTNELPSASITVSCSDLVCSLDGSGSSDPDGLIASYKWTLGDGSTATGEKVEHTYSQAGTYAIELEVTDDAGGTGSAGKSVTLESPNQPPNASFSVQCTDLTCEFDASASSDEDGIVASFLWQFGDGQGSESALASHTYASAGTYEVSLEVHDDDGSMASATQVISVSAPPPDDPAPPDGPPPGEDPLNTTIYPGEEIQAAVDANPAGAEFLIKAGVHRMQSVRPKSGNVFSGEAGAILSGARELTEFQRDGNLWFVSGQTQENMSRTGQCLDGTDGMNEASPRCNYPEDLFFDDIPLAHVASMSNVGPGTWYFDYAADRIYFWDDPSGHRVETSVTERAFHGESATGLVIRGLVIEKYANPAQIAAVATYNANDVVIEDNVIRLNHGIGVAICCGSNGRMSRNTVTMNGQMGLGSYRGVDLLVEQNEISYNNYAGYKTGWEAGGNKFVQTTRLRIIDNYSHHNRGKGFWTDGDNVDSWYEGNRIEYNTDYGIFHEVSYSVVITTNEITGNGWHGILIDTSTDAEVFGNTVTGNGTRSVPSGFQYQVWSRNGRDGESGLFGVWETRNMYVHDNRISGAHLAGMIGPDRLFSTEYNNRFEANTYISDGGVSQPFHWGGAARDWSGWRDQGNDQAGSYSGG